MSNLADRGTLRGRLKENTTDYNALINKPAINGHTLVGNKTGHELDLANLEDIINVEANPEGASSGNLNRIKIGTNIYEIPGVVVYGEASGAIATFTDGGDNKPLKSLKLSINPVQDLHGYDRPWAEGARKNKLPPSSETTDISDNGVTLKRNANGTYSLSGTATADASLTWDITKTIGVTAGQKICLMNSILNVNISFSFRKSNDASVIGLSFNALNRVYTTTADYSDIAKIRITIPNGTNVNGVTFSPMIVDGSADTTTFDPYSNICPISGWDECKVQRAGKNLLAIPITIYSYNQTFENSFYIKKGTYTLSYSISITNRIGIRLYDLSGNLITDIEHKPTNTFTYNNNVKAYYQGADSSGGNKTIQVSIVDDCYMLVISNVDSSNYTNVQLELGSIATDFEPYNGTTYPITWSEAGEVFGGELDYSNSEWSATKTWHKVDLGDLTWTKDSTSDYSYFWAQPNPLKSTASAYTYSFLCSQYTPTTKIRTQLNDLEIGVYNTNSEISRTRIAIRDDRYANATTSEFKEAVEGIQLVYHLKEPQDITLDTPLPTITTLLGTNNIGSDTGEVIECVYERDLNIAINKLISG